MKIEILYVAFIFTYVASCWEINNFIADIIQNTRHASNQNFLAQHNLKRSITIMI